MPLVPLPPLSQHLTSLSLPPSAPHSFNLLHLLLAPFLLSTSPTTPSLPPTWEAILSFYGPGTSILHFTSPTGKEGWATLLSRPPHTPCNPRPWTKVSLAFSDSRPGQEGTRQGLMEQVMRHLKEEGEAGEIYISGLPDGLIGVFESGVKESRGRSLSYKVQKRLSSFNQDGRELDSKRFERDVVKEEEVQGLLEKSGSSHPVAAFLPTIHMSACIREKETGQIVSWAFLYDDLSIAALHTLPSHRSLSLASHTIALLATHLQEAYASLPPVLRDAVDGGGDKGVEAWIAADWDDGNPAGRGFFAREGFEKMEEGVRWARGVL